VEHDLHMTHLWFRARLYGWGWTPAAVEGWLVLAAFIVGIIIDIAVLQHRLHGGADLRPVLTTFLVWIAVLVAALIAVCWLTGERPRWRWGK
jgi:hypothetical protein